VPMRQHDRRPVPSANGRTLLNYRSYLWR
jgi:hypothetical protein